MRWSPPLKNDTEYAGITFSDRLLGVASTMSTERPAAEELRQGMTVEIVQEDADVRSTDEEPIHGEIGAVYGDDPDGPRVKLKSGVVGHVQSVVVDE